MKKTAILMLALCCVWLSGCEDIEPTDWDVKSNKDGKWEIRKSGTVAAAGVTRTAKCDQKPVCPEGCIEHGGYRYVEFEPGFEKINIQHLKHSVAIKVGQVGYLYKHNVGSKDKFSWFRWLPEGPTDPVKEINVSEFIKNMNEDDKELEVKKSKIVYQSPQWKSFPSERPDRYQIVLLRLRTGVITTGHLNHINEWKLETNKEENIRDVASWKKIDLN